MFIHPFPKCSACFANIRFLSFSAGYQMYDIINFTSDVLGKSCSLNDLCVKLHFTIAIFFRIGHKCICLA